MSATRLIVAVAAASLALAVRHAAAQACAYNQAAFPNGTCGQVCGTWEYPVGSSCAAYPSASHKHASDNAASVNTGDTAWVLTAGALVMLMTPGLALFYGGLSTAGNILNTMMLSMTSMALISMVWILIGYSLASSRRGTASAAPGCGARSPS